MPVDQASRADGSYLGLWKFNGWVWSGGDVCRQDQASIPVEKRGCDVHCLSATCPHIHITILFLIPNIFQSKFEPGRLLELDRVFSGLDVECVIAIAVCGSLLNKTITGIQVNANATDAALTSILNAILIFVMPDTVSKNEFCLRDRFISDFTIAMQRSFWLGKFTMKNSEMTRRAFSDEKFIDEGCKRKACLWTRNWRKM